jgi:Fe-S-cluster containining protein
LPRVLVKAAFEDLNFECQRCGSCCHHRRPLEFDDLIPLSRLKEFWEKSNLIYLTQKDISNINKRYKLPSETFVDTLYQYDGRSVKVEDCGRKIILDLPVLKSKEDTTCVFYQKDGCKVYTLRPKACRLFPFRVEEETTANGDIILNISYNPSCPGIGKGHRVDPRKLEKLVVEQFLLRTEEIASQVRELHSRGKIAADAQIFRSHPGRNRR